MKIRELLQLEIWSKETSRKILVRAGKVLGRVGIVLGVLVVVLGIILAVEMSWLTSGERKVASAALAEIDAMQNLVQASGNDFEARDRQAKEMVEAAERAAYTGRDRGTAILLSYYLFETEDARRETEFRAFMQQRKIHRSDKSLELDKKSDELNVQTRFMFRSRLHKSLD